MGTPGENHKKLLKLFLETSFFKIVRSGEQTFSWKVKKWNLNNLEVFYHLKY